MDKISIIVPVYKAEKYIKKCLNSLCKQNNKNFEIIVVNDGSPDNSQKIIDDYCKKYPKLIKNYIIKNGGLSYARNFGISKATGEYLGFVDSDDYIEEDMYEELINMIKNDNSQIAVCNMFIDKVDEITIGESCCEYVVATAYEATDMLLSHRNFGNYMCNKLFKKELFKDIKFPEGKKLEDVATCYKLINKASLISISNKPLYHYVQHTDSITSNLHTELEEDTFSIYERRREDLIQMYPTLIHKINSSFFTAAKLNFIISLKSKRKNKNFQNKRIKDMKKNYLSVLKDKSIPFRVKVSSLLITLFPYKYFKIKEVFKSDD